MSKLDEWLFSLFIYPVSIFFFRVDLLHFNYIYIYTCMQTYGAYECLSSHISSYNIFSNRWSKNFIIGWKNDSYDVHVNTTEENERILSCYYVTAMYILQPIRRVWYTLSIHKHGNLNNTSVYFVQKHVDGERLETE